MEHRIEIVGDPGSLRLGVEIRRGRATGPSMMHGGTLVFRGYLVNDGGCLRLEECLPRVQLVETLVRAQFLTHELVLDVFEICAKLFIDRSGTWAEDIDIMLSRLKDELRKRIEAVEAQVTAAHGVRAIDGYTHQSV